MAPINVHHTRATSEALAGLIPDADLVPPPWGEDEWLERMEPAGSGESLFARWPLLVALLGRQRRIAGGGSHAVAVCQTGHHHRRPGRP